MSNFNARQSHRPTNRSKTYDISDSLRCYADHLATITGPDETIAQLLDRHFHILNSTPGKPAPASAQLDLNTLVVDHNDGDANPEGWRSIVNGTNDPLVPCQILERHNGHLAVLIPDLFNTTIITFEILSQAYPDVEINVDITGVNAHGYEYAAQFSVAKGISTSLNQRNKTERSSPESNNFINTQFERQRDRIIAANTQAITDLSAKPID